MDRRRQGDDEGGVMAFGRERITEAVGARR
jgi:hypothetical protein